MTHPFFAWENGVIDAAVCTSRTQHVSYPHSNLNHHRLWPGYRSSGGCLNLNGTDQYLSRAAEGFQIVADLTIEIMLYIDNVDATYRLVDKLEPAAGFLLQARLSDLRLFLGSDSMYVRTTGSVLKAQTWQRIKVVFDASDQEVSFFVDGVEVARGNNSTQTNCDIAGTIPSSLATGSHGLLIGSSGSTSFFPGKIAWLGIDQYEHDHGGYLEPADCEGFWNFKGLNGSGVVEDISNYQSRHLTPHQITSDNFQPTAACEWISFNIPAGQELGIVCLDRRHNLSDGATVRLLRGTPTVVYNAPDYSTNYAAFTTNVSSGQAAIINVEPVENASTWWLEICDPDNTDGYIEIPYLYLGTHNAMSRGFQRGSSYSHKTYGVQQQSSVGTFARYNRSGSLWNSEVQFKLRPGDAQIIEALREHAARMQPFVFSEDGTAENTRLVYWADAQAPRFQHIVNDISMVTMDLQEVGGGI